MNRSYINNTNHLNNNDTSLSTNLETTTAASINKIHKLRAIHNESPISKLTNCLVEVGHEEREKRSVLHDRSNNVPVTVTVKEEQEKMKRNSAYAGNAGNTKNYVNNNNEIEEIRKKYGEMRKSEILSTGGGVGDHSNNVCNGRRSQLLPTTTSSSMTKNPSTSSSSTTNYPTRHIRQQSQDINQLQQHHHEQIEKKNDSLKEKFDKYEKYLISKNQSLDSYRKDVDKKAINREITKTSERGDSFLKIREEERKLNNDNNNNKLLENRYVKSNNGNYEENNYLKAVTGTTMGTVTGTGIKITTMGLDRISEASNSNENTFRGTTGGNDVLILAGNGVGVVGVGVGDKEKPKYNSNSNSKDKHYKEENNYKENEKDYTKLITTTTTNTNTNTYTHTRTPSKGIRTSSSILYDEIIEKGKNSQEKQQKQQKQQQKQYELLKSEEENSKTKKKNISYVDYNRDRERERERDRDREYVNDNEIDYENNKKTNNNNANDNDLLARFDNIENIVLVKNRDRDRDHQQPQQQHSARPRFESENQSQSQLQSSPPPHQSSRLRGIEQRLREREKEFKEKEEQLRAKYNNHIKKQQEYEQGKQQHHHQSNEKEKSNTTTTAALNIINNSNNNNNKINEFKLSDSCATTGKDDKVVAVSSSGDKNKRNYQQHQQHQQLQHKELNSNNVNINVNDNKHNPKLDKEIERIENKIREFENKKKELNIEYRPFEKSIDHQHHHKQESKSVQKPSSLVSSSHMPSTMTPRRIVQTAATTTATSTAGNQQIQKNNATIVTGRERIGKERDKERGIEEELKEMRERGRVQQPQPQPQPQLQKTYKHKHLPLCNNTVQMNNEEEDINDISIEAIPTTYEERRKAILLKEQVSNIRKERKGNEKMGCSFIENTKPMYSERTLPPSRSGGTSSYQQQPSIKAFAFPLYRIESEAEESSTTAEVMGRLPSSSCSSSSSSSLLNRSQSNTKTDSQKYANKVEFENRTSCGIEERKRKLQNLSGVDNQQSVKKLVSLLIQQCVLDEEFRNAKIWFDSELETTKWKELKRIINVHPNPMIHKSVHENQDGHIEEFLLTEQENNPFFSVNHTSKFSLEKMIECFIKCKTHWEQNIQGKMSHEGLSKDNFNSSRFDLDKKGHIELEDLVRFLNIESGSFYRNRDLVLIFKRFSQRNMNKNKEALYFSNILSVLTSKE